ncbi:hypothetical protein [Rhizobium sp. BK068]|uniref:hypothetical protein n=1 Tax=Rhizobium sp. BK068 TaxID=2512130 RepID=UPI001046C9E7|nr:hypothetical protein [Rhizobium sp. BK068]TCM67868.1 hypothetical protein EV291_13227 [Rhizobium sp. BK068]
MPEHKGSSWIKRRGRHVGVGEGKKIAGKIVQVSQAEVARGGTFFDFVTVEGDDGQVYKIRRLIAGSDVNPDIVIGSHLTMHIQAFRTVYTWFVKRNVLHAVETDRGVATGLTRAEKFGFLMTILFVTPISMVLSLIPSALITLTYQTFFGGGASAFWFLLVPAALILHGGIVMALTLISMSVTARLTGLGAARTVYNGRAVKEV